MPHEQLGSPSPEPAPAPRGGRRAPRPHAWLAELRSGLELAALGRDPEGVHRVRVAAARLSTWLYLGRQRALRDDLHWLRSALGEARDLDVAVGAGDLPLAARARLAGLRGAQQAGVRALGQSERAEALQQAISRLGRVSWRAPVRGLRRLARASLACGREWESRLADPERLHALRKRLRRLRYSLEWLGRESAPVRVAQDALGLCCEQLVRARLLERGATPQERLAARRLREDLDALRQAALAAWRGARPWVRSCC